MRARSPPLWALVAVAVASPALGGTIDDTLAQAGLSCIANCTPLYSAKFDCLNAKQDTLDCLCQSTYAQSFFAGDTCDCTGSDAATFTRWIEGICPTYFDSWSATFVSTTNSPTPTDSLSSPADTPTSTEDSTSILATTTKTTASSDSSTTSSDSTTPAATPTRTSSSSSQTSTSGSSTSTSLTTTTTSQSSTNSQSSTGSQTTLVTSRTSSQTSSRTSTGTSSSSKPTGTGIIVANTQSKSAIYFSQHKNWILPVAIIGALIIFGIIAAISWFIFDCCGLRDRRGNYAVAPGRANRHRPWYWPFGGARPGRSETPLMAQGNIQFGQHPFSDSVRYPYAPGNVHAPLIASTNEPYLNSNANAYSHGRPLSPVEEIRSQAGTPAPGGGGYTGYPAAMGAARTASPQADHASNFSYESSSLGNTTNPEYSAPSPYISSNASILYGAPPPPAVRSQGVYPDLGTSGSVARRPVPNRNTSDASTISTGYPAPAQRMPDNTTNTLIPNRRRFEGPPGSREVSDASGGSRDISGSSNTSSGLASVTRPSGGYRPSPDYHEDY